MGLVRQDQDHAVLVRGTYPLPDEDDCKESESGSLYPTRAGGREAVVGGG